MSVFPESAAERYDRALHLARKSHLPKNYPVPRPSAEWPSENIPFLEEYRTWLYDGGLSVNVIQQLYIPSVGHVLGLALKPFDQLDLDVDCARMLAYLKAKHASEEWYHNSGIALEKFKQFMRLRRGQVTITFQPMGRDRYVQGLPAWLIEYLDRYHRLMEAHWRPARSNQRSLAFWSAHTVIWQWLCAQRPITRPDEVKRQDLLDYVDRQLELKYAASTINNHLRSFHAFLLYLQEHDFHIPAALLRSPVLKEPDRLPRYLTDEEVCRVRDDFERRVNEARHAAQRRDALLDRAAFYLMWQAGLRLGEVEELRVEDLDLPKRKLIVRQGKNRKDRAIYLTDTIVRTLQAYLAVRGAKRGEAEHVFLYRHLPVCKELIWAHMKYAGERVGVKVTPHRLRHTCATQLLNAGCKITSIQQLFGHREISTTLIYARVHDQTVADDYYAAMQRIEKSLEITAKTKPADEVVKEQPSLDLFTHAQLLNLIDQLAAPQLEVESRLNLVGQMRGMLTSNAPQPVMIAA